MNTKCGAGPEIEWLVVVVLVVEGLCFPFFGPLVVSLRLGYLKNLLASPMSS